VIESILKPLEGFLKDDEGIQTDIVYTALLSLAVAHGELGFNFRIIRTLLEGKGDVGVSSNFLSLLNYITTFSGGSVAMNPQLLFAETLKPFYLFSFEKGIVPRSPVEMKTSTDYFDENHEWELPLSEAHPSSIASNGAYLFIHNQSGLSKIGTGFQG